MTKQILVSGIKPTGDIHIGNYLGTLKNWVELQDKYNCFFFIADWHALTIKHDPKNYQDLILKTAMTLLSVGIDPKKSTLFVQSHLSEHAELCWLFNTLTPVAELERMTQYKDEAKQHKDNINAGLLDYPVLMSADILLYKPEVVPVGHDQLQHLELANVIAKKFNNRFGQYFEEVKPNLSKSPRLMSLTEPDKKMSKSLGPNNYIALDDSPEMIRKKVMSAVTDVGPTGSSEMSSGVRNLFILLEEFADKQTVVKYKNSYLDKTLKYSELKAELAEAIIKILSPIQERKAKLMKDQKKVQKILLDGAKQARTIAQKNLLEIKKLMGLV
jgi:tryptophanyl-tRNA synthetase